MVKLNSRPGAPRRVASIARSGRRYMTGRLASRIDSIMTGRTNPRDAIMGETRPGPGQSSVAILADKRGLGVSHGFTHGFDPVMAIDAAAQDCRMIYARGNPGGLEVAVLALVGAPDMRGAPPRIAANSASVVANRAAGGCSLEEAGNMAVLAGYPLVSAGKGEAGSEMIEIRR